jgi:hypothetical protein
LQNKAKNSSISRSTRIGGALGDNPRTIYPGIATRFSPIQLTFFQASNGSFVQNKLFDILFVCHGYTLPPVIFIIHALIFT